MPCTVHLDLLSPVGLCLAVPPLGTTYLPQHFGDADAALLDATVASRLCWPSLPSDNFVLPEFIKREMARCRDMRRDTRRDMRREAPLHVGDTNLLLFYFLIIFFRYEKQYLHVKAPRKLVWKPSLGCVTLDVTFEDRAAPLAVFASPWPLCLDLPRPPHAPPA